MNYCEEVPLSRCSLFFSIEDRFLNLGDSLPGCRLLNRAKERRSFLNQQLAAMETEGNLGSTVSSVGIQSPDSDISLATETHGFLPLQNRFETQRTILSHLSIMQQDSTAPLEPNPSRVGRRHARNQGDSDYPIRSPNNVPHSQRIRSTSHRELPPLQADNERSSAGARKRPVLSRKIVTGRPPQHTANRPPQHAANSLEPDQALELLIGPSNSRSLSHPTLPATVSNSSVQSKPKIECSEVGLNVDQGRSSAPAVVGEGGYI